MTDLVTVVAYASSWISIVRDIAVIAFCVGSITR